MAHRRARPPKAARAAPTPTRIGRPVDDTAVVANGWVLLRWVEFRERWDALVADVEELRRRDPEHYRSHPKTRFLALLVKIVMHDVPRDPRDDRYRLGKTMGGSYKFWRRAKFGGRFRLFFRFQSGSDQSDRRMIAYVWLNDEGTLRKAGGRTNVYAVFKAKLEQDKPPSNWDELARACEVWRASPTGSPPLC